VDLRARVRGTLFGSDGQGVSDRVPMADRPAPSSRAGDAKPVLGGVATAASAPEDGFAFPDDRTDALVDVFHLGQPRRSVRSCLRAPPDAHF
jgi:hypothetical protein